MQGLCMADTWHPTRPLRLASVAQVLDSTDVSRWPPNIPHPLQAPSWTVPAPWGPAHLEVKHEHLELLGLLLSSQLPSQRGESRPGSSFLPAFGSPGG